MERVALAARCCDRVEAPAVFFRHCLLGATRLRAVHSAAAQLLSPPLAVHRQAEGRVLRSVAAQRVSAAPRRRVEVYQRALVGVRLAVVLH